MPRGQAMELPGLRVGAVGKDDFAQKLRFQQIPRACRLLVPGKTSAHQTHQSSVQIFRDQDGQQRGTGPSAHRGRLQDDGIAGRQCW